MWSDLTIMMERSIFSVERFNFSVERSDGGRSDRGGN